MSEVQGKQVTMTHAETIEGMPEQIFPLLCPVREYEWIDTWQCRMVRSHSGVAEPGCVFVTELQTHGEPMVWITMDYTPPRHIAFARTTAHTASTLHVDLHPAGPDATHVIWEETTVGLDAEGDAQVAALSTERYVLLRKALNRALEHYVRTGDLLPMADAAARV